MAFIILFAMMWARAEATVAGFWVNTFISFLSVPSEKAVRIEGREDPRGCNHTTWNWEAANAAMLTKEGGRCVRV